MPVYDMIGKRVEGDLHVKISEDGWENVNHLPLEVVSVYNVQQFNKTMSVMTSTLHVVVRDVTPPSVTSFSDALKFTYAWVIRALADKNCADMRVLSSTSSNITLRSDVMDAHFEVSVHELKLGRKDEVRDV